MTIRFQSTRGFTLLETLIATLVMATGLLAAGHIFWFTVRTNVTNRQRSTATLLLSEKLERLRGASIRHQIWEPGGSLNPDAPAAGYFDYASSPAAPGGTGPSFREAYLRLWDISGTDPRSVTVVVYVERGGMQGQRVELARGQSMRTLEF
jgi:prepilin-type N-terminal cleavage/methylation domain-containing protein